MTTTPDTVRAVAIHDAHLSIRAVRVDGRPMTVSVFNQLPTDDLGDDDEAVGWVNRCPASCRAERGHRHLLVVRDGEPWLVETGVPFYQWAAAREWEAEARDRIALAEDFDHPPKHVTPDPERARQHRAAADRLRRDASECRAYAEWLDAFLASLPQIYVAA